VSEFLVETYASRFAKQVTADLSLVAEELTREGTPVRFLRSIFVPEDETCFYLVRAASADAVRAAAARSGLLFERITEAVFDADADAG
jgi:Protein of unknown function (DUF4242)